MTAPLDMRIDVSDAIGLADAQIAMSVFLPDPQRLPDTPIVLFASPGGGYARGYFDIHVEGHVGYSEAEYHVARGFIYIAYDHLGVGDSTTRYNADIRMETIAAANDAAVRQILAQLAEGTLAPGFPPVEKPFVVGSGQSLGGGLTMIMQGRHHTFDAIAPLGVSGTHTVLPQPNAELARLTRSTYVFTRGTPNAELVQQRGQKANPDWVYPFHWEDVPADILKADMEAGYPARKTAPAWGSLTLPPCVIGSNSPHFFAAEVSQIDVPVLLAMGERDVCPEPHREPAAFTASPDISLFIAPTMAHMHNFASSRAKLWARLNSWAQMIAGAARDA
ncbi:MULTISPECIES: hypothetical protein [unclassified Sphingobium]|uniref:hypothetical protein n=1 Tax=unclassified Sphingobium TaxID=2611147 RepID=UPI000D155FE3|nr:MULTISPECIES: hypothetical protein [unclassified Sphingobium]MBG6120150.1 pimeloyl-ACP methyl ester carboxylesterase [Sphingobium sp. JAI105]PSO12813.1 hypothetical protein C7E20_03365 [Sphingobium sp. AEW4]TWD05649.1 hypothetical protein FB595_1099 [Sphingobium sp. AEW010]TWD23202.1 hypothetical protein FB596_1099 [Sphingobium sp. AEW013]TWD25062.1 hypothetical protein FB594_1099 [Sphingobium sp. AEW001]